MLGCANCRSGYSIDGGVVDLRAAGLEPFRLTGGMTAPDPDDALRVAALLGVQPPGAWVGLIEPCGGVAPAVAGHLAEARFISVTPVRPRGVDADPRRGDGGVSQVVASERMPFRTGILRAAAVLGNPAPELLAETGRILAPGGRLVVEGSSEETAETLLGLGFTVHLRQPETVVAAAPGPR